jgi:hypothetical protein
MTHNNSKLQKSLECNGTTAKLCGMDPDDERCNSGPIKPLNISQTLCHPYLATLVGITLYNVKCPKMRTLHKVGITGYNEVSKAYRIYVPTRRKVIVCRDVQFEEERALRRSRSLHHFGD